MGKKADRWKKLAQEAQTAHAETLEAIRELEQERGGLKEQVALLEGVIASFKPEQARLRLLEEGAPVLNAVRGWWAAPTELQSDKRMSDLIDACSGAWGMAGYYTKKGAIKRPHPKMHKK